MATITIEIPESVFSQLHNEAEHTSTTVEQILVDLATARAQEDERARAAADRHYSRFQSVFDRLAQ